MARLHRTKSSLPLRGVRIVTVAVNVPGPVAADRLRHLGAQVVKVEPPAGDPLERLCPAWYRELVKKQKVIRLDLRIPNDRAALDRQLAKADVVITSSRRRSLQRLSLDWRRVHKQFPQLCYVALVGDSGSNHNVPGHDLTYQAAAGLLSPPQLPKSLLADLAAAERAVSAAVSLLLLRSQTNAAQHLEVALTEAAGALSKPLRHGLTSPGAILGGGFAGYQLYRAEGGWVAVAALEPHFWEKLQQELGLKAAAHSDLTKIFHTKTAEKWQRWAEQRDLPIVAVRLIRRS